MRSTARFVSEEDRILPGECMPGIPSTATGGFARSWATLADAGGARAFSRTSHGDVISARVRLRRRRRRLFADRAIHPEGMKRSGEQRPPSRVRVVWDEENLHQLESTKSPKQKITEPKTPYYAPDDGGLSPTPDDERVQMDSATHAEAVRHALSEVATEDRASCSRSSGSSWNFSGDESDGMNGDEGSDGSHPGSFEEHRRKHYDNEYKKAKLLAPVDPELAAEEEDAAAANGEAESSSEAALRGPPRNS